MSVDLMVYLRRETLPTSDDWGSAVNDSGFAIGMDRTFDPVKFSGYLPCRYQGAPSGFEYIAGAVSDDERELFDVPPEFDFVVTLTTRGDDAELACAAIALGVLCQLSNGVLYDPQSGEYVRPDEALEWVNEIVKQLAN